VTSWKKKELGIEILWSYLNFKLGGIMKPDSSIILVAQGCRTAPPVENEMRHCPGKTKAHYLRE
jgi:hypothetical protein